MKHSSFAGTVQLAVAAGLVMVGTVPLASAGAQQSLYSPRAVAKAFRNGTRSPDGRPGPKYWQNRARYDITVTALPPDRTIRGTEQVAYANNRPDTLKNLVIKLLLNIHKPGAPRAGGASADYLTAGVQIDSLRVNGQLVKWPGDANTFTPPTTSFDGFTAPAASPRRKVAYVSPTRSTGSRTR